MTVDTSREAVQALIAELCIPPGEITESARATLVALLDERDVARDASVWRDTIDEQRAYIRDLEATNRKISERSANHHDNAIDWKDRAERAEAALEGSEQSRLAGEQKLAGVQAERDKLTAQVRRLYRMVSIYDAAQTIKGTGGAVEIEGVRIEPCDDEFGVTETTRKLGRLVAKLDAVKAFIANRSVIGGMDRMRLQVILADTDEGNSK